MSRDRSDSSRRSRDDDRKHAKKKKSSKEKRRQADSDASSSDTEELPRGVNKISEDDYFLRATEFRVWLKQRKGKYLEELSTDKAMHYFRSKFVKRWNSGRLDHMYYTGIPEDVLEQTKRTRHTWGFVNKLNESESMRLATAKDSVTVSTRKEDLIAHPHLSHRRPADEPVHRDSKYGPSDDRKRGRRDEHHDQEDEEERRRRRRLDDRRDRKRRESDLEELVPRETGREAQIEKRRQLADKLHGAARDRDANRDGLDLDDEFLMGGGRGAGADDLQRRLGQRASARQRKDDEVRARIATAEANEAARMDKFLQDLGIPTTGSQRITIQPRRD